MDVQIVAIGNALVDVLSHETDEFVAVHQLALTDNCPNHRVEAWAVAPTCQNAYSHVYES